MRRVTEMVFLRELADIQVGSSIRGKLPIDPNGNAYAIQQGNISLDGISGSLERILHPKYARDRLRDGDVLLRSKGSPIVAAEFKEEEAEMFPTIAASAILILRPKREILMPAFLVWILNCRWGQQVLAARRTGQTIPVISRKALDDIAVPVPSVEEQVRICELTGLAKRHEQLASQFREKIDDLLIARTLSP